MLRSWLGCGVISVTRVRVLRSWLGCGVVVVVISVTRVRVFRSWLGCVLCFSVEFSC